MVRQVLLALLLAHAISNSIAFAHDVQSDATYIANAGVMVSHGDSKVVFDSLFAPAEGPYAHVPDEVSTALDQGNAPYDNLEAVFVSHVHWDHFSAEPAVAFLRAHPKIKLYGTQQVETAIGELVGTDDPLMERVVGVDLKPGDAAMQFSENDLQIDVVAIPHSGEKSRHSVQNVVWRVAFDEQTHVFHLGDAEPNPADFSPVADHFASRPGGLALIPFWFFGAPTGQSILDTVIKPDDVIGVHVPVAAQEEPEKWRARFGDNLFITPGEKRSLN